MMRRWRRWLTMLALALLIGAWATRDWWAPPENIGGSVAHVADGDSFVMADVKIRLAGIDAPEYHQPCRGSDGQSWACGREARSALVRLIARSPLHCAVEARDRYGRHISRCTAAGGDIGEAMVRAGWAVSPSERGTARYADAESAARDARRGIWRGTFDMPSAWRASHPQRLTMGE